MIPIRDIVCSPFVRDEIYRKYTVICRNRQTRALDGPSPLTRQPAAQEVHPTPMETSVPKAPQPVPGGTGGCDHRSG